MERGRVLLDRWKDPMGLWVSKETHETFVGLKKEVINERESIGGGSGKVFWVSAV